MKKILLTTVHRPLGVESETCTPNIQAEMYHVQVTRSQGPFSIRSVCTGWGLEFIAANLEAPVTVLHYPTKSILLRELRKGYDYVGVSFVMCTFPKTIELCEMVRRVAPQSKIVLGGYGTVLEECDQYADFVCREEGVNFFRRLLGEPEVGKFKTPRIMRKLKIMSVTTRPEAIIPAGLGCSRGCDFCCTSHFFDRKHVPLLKSGREIHEAMVAADFRGKSFRNIGIIDEDFLSDRNRIEEMIHLNAKEIEKPIFFSCLTSLLSLSQYTDEELLSMGLSGVWVGIESKRAKYKKLKNFDAAVMIDALKHLGIIPLTSMIIGYDWHDEETIEEDFQYLVSLKPAFSQIMIYSPCPQTPLYRKVQRLDRHVDIPYKYHDGFHTLFKHPNLSGERLERILGELFEREYEELGPSVCRVLEVQMLGYITLHNSANPLFRARAREQKKLCLEIYPLLKTAIKEAPSDKVRAYLVSLKEQVEDLFRIPKLTKTLEFFVPALAAYTRLKDKLIPNPQPPALINRYRFQNGMQRPASGPQKNERDSEHEFEPSPENLTRRREQIDVY